MMMVMMLLLWMTMLLVVMMPTLTAKFLQAVLTTMLTMFVPTTVVRAAESAHPRDPPCGPARVPYCQPSPTGARGGAPQLRRSSPSARP